MDAIRADCYVDYGPGVAPANSPRIHAPLTAAGTTKSGQIVMSKEMAEEVMHRLRCLVFWPDAAQVVLNVQAGIHQVELEEADKATAEILDLALEEPSPDFGVPMWAAVSVGVGLLVVGGFAGYGFAQIDSQ